MAAGQNEPNEQSPLLGDGTTSNTRSANQAIIRARRITIAICFILRFLFLIGAALIEIPLIQLQETMICDRYRALLVVGPGPQPFRSLAYPRCKQEGVQNELSIIRFWAIISQLFPSLIMGIPMGIAADRYGRKVILGLALLGTTLSTCFAVLICATPGVFPLRLIWLAPVFTFIGGGETMVSTMVYTIVADVTPEGQRSLTFSYLVATMMVGGMLANPLAYVLMRENLWLSIYSGISMMTFCIILGFSVPETLEMTVTTRESRGHHTTSASSRQYHNAILEQVKSGTQRFVGFLNMLVKEERRVGLLLLSSLLTTFGKDSALMLMQYITVKFQWEWSEAGLVLSVQQAISLILLTIILPFVTKRLLGCGMNPKLKDLWLARASGLLQIIGGFTVALAPTSAVLFGGVAFSGLAAGYGICARSLMTSLLSHNIAMLYTTINILEVLGIFIASPLLAALFRLGLQWGGAWTGLPFLMAGLLYTGALFIIGWIKVDDTSIALPEASAESLE